MILVMYQQQDLKQQLSILTRWIGIISSKLRNTGKKM